ncbi:hypothetical protein H8B06_16820 [Sphingobacterium sp. DN00404]|uniref:Uncharacterized protein n=1 Tax=Sphingobacterium micropteri TaxID=2763501 RepID=A0ABR7YTI8_9SPHI|nr:hypothetical protein [Sphingobacterium micropteri]MBD1434491.1 hypothetical protein [Sphingobacterium micropteri]
MGLRHRMMSKVRFGYPFFLVMISWTARMKPIQVNIIPYQANMMCIDMIKIPLIRGKKVGNMLENPDDMLKNSDDMVLTFRKRAIFFTLKPGYRRQELPP